MTITDKRFVPSATAFHVITPGMIVGSKYHLYGIRGLLTVESKFRGYKYDPNVGTRLLLTVGTESVVIPWYLRKHTIVQSLLCKSSWSNTTLRHLYPCLSSSSSSLASVDSARHRGRVFVCVALLPRKPRNILTSTNCSKSPLGLRLSNLVFHPLKHS